MIKNCPVTARDVDQAEKIFGPDIATLKGKSTRRRPKTVEKDEIEIPPEIVSKHHDLILCFDIMFLNNIPMMASIDRSIRFRGLVILDDKTKDEYFRGLDVIFRKYNQAGFKISEIHCDGAFKPIMNEIKDEFDAVMDFTSRNEHVPEAERNVRSIKDRIRVKYYWLPFKTPPINILKYMAMVEMDMYNIFPAKGGISAYYSPKQFYNRCWKN